MSSRKNDAADILCLGEPMLEFNQQPDGTFVEGFGGDTSNCAISAARQGARVGYITSVGDDQFGRKFMDLWEFEGVDISQVKIDANSPTGIYFVTHDKDGHHFSYYRKHSAASAMNPMDLCESYIADAKVLHVSAISQAISDSASDTVIEAINIANRNGTQVAYDTNLRLNLWSKEKARTIVHETMKHCHIALPSYDDACVLTELVEPNEIIDFYLALGAKFVVLKMGDKGAIVASHTDRESIAPVKVDSIDANGAGDTFAGAFLAEFIKGLPISEAASYANVAAAISTCSKGAVTSIPDHSQVLQMRRQLDR